MSARLPIIYVRGFAGGQSGIDEQTEDPFYGFNLGSTHVRVGGRGDPLFYQFESPLLRLMIDHGYELIVKGGQLSWLQRQGDGAVEPATVWIHRFYDVAAATFGERPKAFSLERAAEDLLDLIQLVRRKTGAPRVHLVAHSMGGLICRCVIQKIIPEHRSRGDDVPAAPDCIDRLFTYATPHGGIEFDVGFGMLERLRDTFGIAGGDIFGPARMYAYLTPGEERGKAGDPPPGWRPQDMSDEAFPKERIFTLIGTNPGDYDAARGLSSRAVGAKSDGLVQIENAYVPGAKFAFVHRSHSGRYGIVNSEEGYQNLRRFLLGDLEVQADLVGVRLPSGDRDVVWQAEAELAVRGLPILMHQQIAAHHCPVVLRMPGDTADHPVPLVTTFLIADSLVRPADRERARYTLHLRVLSLRERRGIFDFSDHLEQSADFDDLLVVDVGVEQGKLVAWTAWNSELPSPLRDYEPQGPPLPDEEPAAGVWVSTAPLPRSVRAFLGPDAGVRLTVRDRGHSGRTGLTEPGRPPGRETAPGARRGPSSPDPSSSGPGPSSPSPSRATSSPAAQPSRGGPLRRLLRRLRGRR